MARFNYKPFILVAFAFAAQFVSAQQPIDLFTPLVGTWVGKAQFQTSKTPIDASVKITTAVAGHYFEFQKVIYFPGRAEESLSMLTFDPRAGLFEMWTFNQHNPGARLTTGTIGEGHTLTLSSPAVQELGRLTAYRESYHIDSMDQFTLKFEVKLNNEWKEEYSIVYSRQKPAGTGK